MIKTKITFYFMRNGDYTAWTVVKDPGMDTFFDIGDDCFDGTAGAIPAWCEKNGYRCVVHTENQNRFIDWEGKRVYYSEQEYLCVRRLGC